MRLSLHQSNAMSGSPTSFFGCPAMPIALHIQAGEVLNNKEDVMKRSYLICALFLGVWAVRPGSSHGQTLSPVGSWQVTVLGSDRGIAVMTFSNDFTVSGYGITRKQFGLFTLTGNWAFNSK